MRLIAVLALSSALCSGTSLAQRSLLGPEHAYRGSDFYLRLSVRWFDVEPVTVNPANSQITLPSPALSKPTLVRMFSTDTLPSVINPYVFYKTCPVKGDGNIVTINPSSSGTCRSTVKFSDLGSGKLLLGKSSRGSSLPRLKDIVLPEGIKLVQVVNNNGSVKQPNAAGEYSDSGYDITLYLQFHVDDSAPLTPGEIRMTTEAEGKDVVHKKPFQAKELKPLKPTAPTSFPDIPKLRDWESHMKSLASKWCNKNTGELRPKTMSFGVESQVWFYDGTWVYRQVAAYTGDQEWLNCSKAIAEPYRDYLLANGSSVPQYRLFTSGLMGECKDCEGRYKIALKNAAQYGMMSRFGGDVQDTMMRETAYAIETSLNALKIYGFSSPDKVPKTGRWSGVKTNLDRGADMLLGQLDTVRGENYIYQQTFMIGLAMRALILYWEYSGDPRVPVEIKATLDYIWDELWLPAKPRNRLVYNKSPYGARCDYSCFPYAETTLINLTAPAFAWYWSLTGDEVYQKRGDELFRHSLDEPVNFSGKIFSQNYLWSFDYVMWRQGKPPYRP